MCLFGTVAVKFEQVLIQWMSQWDPEDNQHDDLPRGAITTKRDHVFGDHRGAVRLGVGRWVPGLTAPGYPKYEEVASFLQTKWDSTDGWPDLHTSCFCGGHDLSYALKYADAEHIVSRTAGSRKRDCFVAFLERPDGNERSVTIGRVACFVKRNGSVQIVYEPLQWIGHEEGDDGTHPGLSGSVHLVELSTTREFQVRPVTDVHSRVAILNVDKVGLRAVVVPKFSS